jgi:hypothetical protein
MAFVTRRDALPPLAEICLEDVPRFRRALGLYLLLTVMIAMRPVGTLENLVWRGTDEVSRFRPPVDHQTLKLSFEGSQVDWT